MLRLFRGRQAIEVLSSVDDDPGFPMPPLSNRKQLLLFVVLTVLLSIAAVWIGRAWFKSTHTLTFAVGAENSIDAQFAARLSSVLANSGSSLRLRIVRNPDNDKAVAAFDRKQADLALLRTDAAVPARARSIATLEHDLVMLLSPKNSTVASLAALKGRKVAVLGDERDTAFLKRVLDASGFAGPKSVVTAVPPTIPLDQLLKPGEYAAVLTMDHLSRIPADKNYERVLRGAVGFKLNEIAEARTAARKIPGLTAESFDAGLLSASPKVPDEEIDTIGVHWLMIAQSTMSEQKGAELARTILENKAELALPGLFATKIEPADTDKEALIAAHRGAAQYIDDDTRSFSDRYSDFIYLGMAALSIFGSLSLGIYTAFTRVAPEKAGALATSLLEIGERIDEANSLEVLDTIQEELERLLKNVVMGLRDGTVSGDGLETFRLGYDFVRDSLDLRRSRLSRHAEI